MVCLLLDYTLLMIQQLDLTTCKRVDMGGFSSNVVGLHIHCQVEEAEFSKNPKLTRSLVPGEAAKVGCQRAVALAQ